MIDATEIGIERPKKQQMWYNKDIGSSGNKKETNSMHGDR
ncbi:hypothetical protein AGMMS50233_07940 [Endomicrobiia bacterium]|nr:hypothetical protein AGMMS50233_07940 [Endomicrobiia bacterium]